MNRLFLLLTLPFLALVFSSCEVKQKPIAYGQTNCQHCQMTVADKRYASELVTKTGKAFFFDSAECLIMYLQENKEISEKAQLLLVSDFNKPETLLDAKKAVFLQSKKLPSPMGMYLTAVADNAVATKLKEANGGRILTWNEALNAVKDHAKPE